MKWLKILSAASYICLLVYLVFFARKRSFERRILNYIPFRSTYNYYLTIELDSRRDLYYFITNLLGNVILFLPVPAIISFLLPSKSKYIILLIAFCLTVFIEVNQYLFKVGVADIDDILLNMLGAMLGTVFSRRKSNCQQVEQQSISGH